MIQTNNYNTIATDIENKELKVFYPIILYAKESYLNPSFEMMCERPVTVVSSKGVNNLKTLLFALKKSEHTEEECLVLADFAENFSFIMQDEIQSFHWVNNQKADGSVTPQMYAQLLAIYLYQNDLCNAKFLWKRIPSQAKTENPELAQVWNVGKAMWQRDFPAVYNALNATQWTDNVAEIMKAVHQEVVQRATQLVCRAYTSVNLTTAAALVGSTPEAVAQQKGWVVEGNMVSPPQPLAPTPTVTSSEEQLAKLTDFVSFLEN